MSDDLDEEQREAADPLALTQRFMATANVCGLVPGQVGELYVNEDVLGCLSLGFLLAEQSDGTFAAAPMNVGPAGACCGRPR